MSSAGSRVPLFVSRGAEIVLLLCGGDKSSQARDIETAKRLAITEE
jgi:putative addiction module killer protein